MSRGLGDVYKRQLLAGACALAAILIGLIGNRFGGFYPTWALAWADIGPALW